MYNTDNAKLEELFLQVQKPGRYSGAEPGSIIKDKNKVDVRFAFCFPDTYEIGMSHLGIKILYSLFNKREDIWCERVFAPADDFENLMRQNNIPLFSIESRSPLKEFDFIGFTLQYELSYTNILNMLDLSGVPLLSKDRKSLTPLVVAGGPCACNPEPLADFVDLFFLGEGEEVDLEVIDLYKEYKKSGKTDKQEFLRQAAKIKGVYVPSLYDVYYNDDGTVKKIQPKNGVSPTVEKRIMPEMDEAYYPDNFPVPYTEIVHDRAVQEIFRGCIRGCRFCQAGFIYRPVREKSPEVINRQAYDLCMNTGYDDLSLSSLSTSDYTKIKPLLEEMIGWTEKENISLSLPSLRIDNFSPELLEKMKMIRKSGLTFAPEAGTQRLRDVINKNITEEDILSSCATAFSGGYTSVKLYFMMGLPTETDDDIRGIAELGQKIVDLFYRLPDKPKGKGVNVSISVSNFVPKPFTPFEFCPQITEAEIRRKQQILKESVKSKKISLSWHDSEVSALEGAMARGDRRMGQVILNAFKAGAKMDGWDEYFNYSRWLKAFEDAGLSPEFYANRERKTDEIMPFEHLDYAVSKEFLIKEYKLALAEITTPNCRQKCAGCGAAKYGKGVCFEKCKADL